MTSLASALNQNVLVLNKNYAAIQICDAKKALSLLFQDAAEAVDADTRTYKFDDWTELSAAMQDNPSGFVRTVSLKIAVPEIIRLTKYEKLPKVDVKFTRGNIYAHYGYKCSYCGNKFSTKDLNIDHVIPRAKGGKTNWNNCVPACYPCNCKKDCYSPEEVGMKLLVEPSQPKWKGHQSMLAMNLPMQVRESWQTWLDKAYWNVELEHD